MRNLLLIIATVIISLQVNGQCDLLNNDCSGYPGPNATGFTRTQGTTYTCSSGSTFPYSWYTSGSSNAYIATGDIDVPQGKAISIKITSRKASGYSSQPEVYIRVGGYYTFDYQSYQLPTDNGWVKVGNVTAFDCTTGTTINVPSAIVGGQKVSVCVFPKNASSTNWWAMAGMCITSTTGSAVPVTYEEKFPYGSGWYASSPYVKIPYHSSITGSNAYVYLWSGGVDGGLDNYAALYTGFDITNSTGGTNIITQEINTNNYNYGELRYAFRAQYPCSGPPSYTSDENYTSYAPKVYIEQGQYDKNNWINLPVNSYFPDGKWRYISYDISAYKNQNIKIKIERGGYCSTFTEGVDNIKVYDRNCTLSTQACGDITGPDSPQPNTNVQYSTTAVTGAKYYKWIVRNGGTLYTKPPYIVSGQGTLNATINIGNLAQPIRVICIPYDADLSNAATDSTGVCYAKLSYKAVSAPVCVNLAITGQPAGATKCTGQSASFTVTTTGSEPVYTWKKNGSDISGQSGSTFTINNISVNDAGSYSCVVNNSCSSVTTDAVTLTVNQSPVVNVNPVSQGICNGSQVTLSSSATGTEPVNYQWKKNGTDISGATATDYTISSATSGDAGNYFCLITNVCGSYSSSTAVLTADAAVSITSQPASLVKCLGQSASFSTVATGGDLSYQWKKNNIIIAGETKSVFTINSSTFADSAKYVCQITNTCGEKLSNIAKLSVNDTVLTFIQKPSTITRCEGEAGSLQIKLSGNNILKYQWLKGNKNIAGATSNVYLVDSLVKKDEDFYFCKVNNGCKIISSDTVFILVNQKPLVNSSPITVQKLTGETVRFSISPTGTPPFSYQWKKDNVIIPNATNNAYLISSIALSDAGYYECSISNLCGNKLAGIATLIVKGVVPNTYVIDGMVTYDNGQSTPLNNIKLYLRDKETSAVMDSTVSDSLGYYRFYNVVNGLYKITGKTSKATGGYDPTDALIINRIFLNTYSISDSLKLRAGDVNGDGLDNPTDALIILRRFLKITTSFKAGTWLFSDEPITVSGANVSYNIQGICVGDINGSFTPGKD